jgi:hypothetical protein
MWWLVKKRKVNTATRHNCDVSVLVFEIWNWSVALFVVFGCKNPLPQNCGRRGWRRLFFFLGCKIPSRNFAGGEVGEQEFMIMSVVLTCGIVLESCKIP